MFCINLHSKTWSKSFLAENLRVRECCMVKATQGGCFCMDLFFRGQSPLWPLVVWVMCTLLNHRGCIHTWPKSQGVKVDFALFFTLYFLSWSSMLNWTWWRVYLSPCIWWFCFFFFLLFEPKQAINKRSQNTQGYHPMEGWFSNSLLVVDNGKMIQTRANSKTLEPTTYISVYYWFWLIVGSGLCTSPYFFFAFHCLLLYDSTLWKFHQ